VVGRTDSRDDASRPFKGMPCSAIMSTPRSLVFVAGAFPRSSGPAHGADREDRYRAADHSDPDASGAITGPLLKFVVFAYYSVAGRDARGPSCHSTPRLTNSDTTINTPTDKSKVAANLERILNPLAAYASL
jgi:hypothetical protein